jgi:uncharacterized protein YjgD (DUF1641 family)
MAEKAGEVARSKIAIPELAYLETINELMDQLIPKLIELLEEIHPTLYALRAKMEKEETLLLLEKIADNTDTFLRMVETLEGIRDLSDQLTPVLSKLMDDVYPKIYALRAKMEKEETLLLLEKIADNLELAIKFLDVVERFKQDGTMDALIDLMSRPGINSMINAFTSLSDEEVEEAAKSIVKLTQLSSKLSDPKVVGLLDGMLTTISALELAEPKKVGMFGLILATRNDDAKKTMGILVEFLKNFSKNIKIEI